MTNQHPLTEADAAALRDQAANAYAGNPYATMWDMMLHALRAAHHEGRKYEREHAPAVEVELPSEPATVLRDVRVGHHRYEFAVKLYDGWRAYHGPDYSLHPDHNGVFLRTSDMDECALPDGTRARRKGEHEDGTPRFVMCAAGLK